MKAVIPEQVLFNDEVIPGVYAGHAFFIAQLLQPGVDAESLAVEIGDGVQALIHGRMPDRMTCRDLFL